MVKQMFPSPSGTFSRALPFLLIAVVDWESSPELLLQLLVLFDSAGNCPERLAWQPL